MAIQPIKLSNPLDNSTNFTVNFNEFVNNINTNFQKLSNLDISKGATGDSCAFVTVDLDLILEYNESWPKVEEGKETPTWWNDFMEFASITEGEEKDYAALGNAILFGNYDPEKSEDYPEYATASGIVDCIDSVVSGEEFVLVDGKKYYANWIRAWKGATESDTIWNNHFKDYHPGKIIVAISKENEKWQIKGSLPWTYVDPRFRNMYMGKVQKTENPEKSEEELEEGVGEPEETVDLISTQEDKQATDNIPTNEDSSCILIWNDTEKGFKANNSFPQLYYNTEESRYCWKINGIHTNVPATGASGAGGKDAELKIVVCENFTWADVTPNSEGALYKVDKVVGEDEEGVSRLTEGTPCVVFVKTSSTDDWDSQTYERPIFFSNISKDSKGNTSVYCAFENMFFPQPINYETQIKISNFLDPYFTPNQSPKGLERARGLMLPAGTTDRAAGTDNLINDNSHSGNARHLIYSDKSGFNGSFNPKSTTGASKYLHVSSVDDYTKLNKDTPAIPGTTKFPDAIIGDAEFHVDEKMVITPYRDRHINNETDLLTVEGNVLVGPRKHFNGGSGSGGIYVEGKYKDEDYSIITNHPIKVPGIVASENNSTSGGSGNGELTFEGNTYIEGDFTVKAGDSDVTNLTVNKDGVDIDPDLYVKNFTRLGTNHQLSNLVDDNVLEVYGHSYFKGNITSAKQIESNSISVGDGGIKVEGLTTLNGDLKVGGTTNLTDNLVVGGKATMNNGATVVGTLNTQNIGAEGIKTYNLTVTNIYDNSQEEDGINVSVSRGKTFSVEGGDLVLGSGDLVLGSGRILQNSRNQKSIFEGPVNFTNTVTGANANFELEVSSFRLRTRYIYPRKDEKLMSIVVDDDLTFLVNSGTPPSGNQWNAQAATIGKFRLKNSSIDFKHLYTTQLTVGTDITDKEVWNASIDVSDTIRIPMPLYYLSGDDVKPWDKTDTYSTRSESPIITLAGNTSYAGTWAGPGAGSGPLLDTVSKTEIQYITNICSVFGGGVVVGGSLGVNRDVIIGKNAYVDDTLQVGKYLTVKGGETKEGKVLSAYFEGEVGIAGMNFGAFEDDDETYRYMYTAKGNILIGTEKGSILMDVGTQKDFRVSGKGISMSFDTNWDIDRNENKIDFKTKTFEVNVGENILLGCSNGKVIRIGENRSACETVIKGHTIQIDTNFSSDAYNNGEINIKSHSIHMATPNNFINMGTLGTWHDKKFEGIQICRGTQDVGVSGRLYVGGVSEQKNAKAISANLLTTSGGSVVTNEIYLCDNIGNYCKISLVDEGKRLEFYFDRTDTTVGMQNPSSGKVKLEHGDSY